VFFERHGPKAVFLGRFVLGLRVWASWLAGATHMRWRSFVFWNALGGICWATAIGLLAYFLGHAAGNAIEAFGIYGLVAVLIAVGAGVIAHRRHQRRVASASSAAHADIAPSDPEGP
jgi:membrane-associated protein